LTPPALVHTQTARDPLMTVVRCDMEFAIEQEANQRKARSRGNRPS
jgi:hypothetical protein